MYAEFGIAQVLVLRQETQGTPDLFGEQAQGAFERVADIIIHAFGGQVGSTVVGGKQR